MCRPRPDSAPLATRTELLRALKAELPDALRKLQSGNIAPVDLAQSAIGPGMGVFSHYSRVVEADGSPMSVRTALGLINQVLDETLSEQESDFEGDTRWALAWFEESGMSPGPYGKAETLSKAKKSWPGPRSPAWPRAPRRRTWPSRSWSSHGPCRHRPAAVRREPLPVR